MRSSAYAKNRKRKPFLDDPAGKLVPSRWNLGNMRSLRLKKSCLCSPWSLFGGSVPSRASSVAAALPPDVHLVQGRRRLPHALARTCEQPSSKIAAPATNTGSQREEGGSGRNTHFGNACRHAGRPRYLANRPASGPARRPCERQLRHSPYESWKMERVGREGCKRTKHKQDLQQRVRDARGSRRL